MNGIMPEEGGRRGDAGEAGRGGGGGAGQAREGGLRAFLFSSADRTTNTDVEKEASGLAAFFVRVSK